MKALILDTSGEHAHLGVAEEGRLISQIVIREGKQFSKFLLTSIEEILQGTTPDFIAIGVGPGSFTGTRIGATVAKTLAYGWGNLPLVPFSSTLLPDLEAIAQLIFESAPANQIELVYISPTP